MATTSLFDEGPNQLTVGPPPDVGVIDPRIIWINKQVTRAEPGVNKWREQARQCYRFRDGKQLADEDERLLKEAGRPTNAFNAAQKFIRYVSGVQRDSFTALLFNAIDIDNTMAQIFGDRMTRYYQWAVEKSRGDQHRARIFEDQLVGGLGWGEVYTDRSQDPRGLVGYARKDPFTMLWPETSQVNLGGINSPPGGTRWRACEEWKDNEELKAMFPQSSALIDASATDSSPVQTWPVVDRVIYKIWNVQTYPLDTLGAKGSKKDKSKVLQFEWWDNAAGYIFEDPLDHTEQFMDEDAFREYQRALSDEHLPSIEVFDRQVGRKWWKAFILNRKYFLDEPDLIDGQRFTFNAMCSHWDETDKIPYGFMRVLIDPQRYANKFFNQMLEIVGRSAKTGIIAESDVFEDKAQTDKFLEDYALPGSVSIVAPNAIKEQKLMPKPEAKVPEAAMAILQFCNDSMQQVTGISEDSLGIGAQTQAGVVIKRRQRAGMVLLAAEFDAETQYRQDEGLIVMDHVKLIADDRLIRVGGPYESEVMKLSDTPFSLTYEITVDEVERDPNLRQFMAELLMGPFGQTMARMGQWQPDWFKYLPIPRKESEKMKQNMVAQQQKAQEDAAKGLPVQGGRGQKKSLIELQSMVKNKDADTTLKTAKAASLLGKGMQDRYKLKQDDMRMMLEHMSNVLKERRERSLQGMTNAQGAMDMLLKGKELMAPPERNGDS